MNQFNSGHEEELEFESLKSENQVGGMTIVDGVGDVVVWWWVLNEVVLKIWLTDFKSLGSLELIEIRRPPV